MWRERESELRLHRRRNANGLIPISAEDNARRRERANMNERERREDAWQRYLESKRVYVTQTPSLMLRKARRHLIFAVLWACVAIMLALGVLLYFLLRLVLPPLW